MEKFVNFLAIIICFICFCIYTAIDYFNNIFLFIPNISESYISEEKWRKRLHKLFRISIKQERCYNQ